MTEPVRRSRVSTPRAGDRAVNILNPLPGARYRVYDVMFQEIADGSGGTVRLKSPRVLQANEPLVVTHELGTCKGLTAVRTIVWKGE